MPEEFCQIQWTFILNLHNKNKWFKMWPSQSPAEWESTDWGCEQIVSLSLSLFGARLHSFQMHSKSSDLISLSGRDRDEVSESWTERKMNAVTMESQDFLKSWFSKVENLFTLETKHTELLCQPYCKWKTTCVHGKMRQEKWEKGNYVKNRLMLRLQRNQINKQTYKTKIEENAVVAYIYSLRIAIVLQLATCNSVNKMVKNQTKHNLTHPNSCKRW